MSVRRAAWWVCPLLLAFALLVRAQTFSNPVTGYDEQFYLLVGDRMWHGALPYVDIFDRKPIGLFLIFAAARALGGDGFLQYKLLALGFVVGTAYLVYRAARPMSGIVPALAAAALYILWLNFMEGEAGQGEVWLNLPMMAAGLLVRRVTAHATSIQRHGALAMLLVGVALQIKYTAVFEGLFFGCALLWVQYRRTRTAIALMMPAVLWIGCALLPTALAALYYWHVGAIVPFMFANFTSMLGKHMVVAWDGLAVIAAIVFPLALLALPLLRAIGQVFLKLWIAVALVAMLAFGAFGSPHYAIPLLAPLCIATARSFERAKRTVLMAGGVVALFAVAGQLVLTLTRINKGGQAEARAVAAAARPVHGCIWVYDGYPALYMLTHSCVPTRWAFPGHLNTLDEASAKAIGVDPAAEAKRILATRPEVIIDDAPAYALGNPVTRALVHAALARDYRLVLSQRTGTRRFRLVYRLR